jgi:hypothetical protein
MPAIFREMPVQRQTLFFCFLYQFTWNVPGEIGNNKKQKKNNGEFQPPFLPA